MTSFDNEERAEHAIAGLRSALTCKRNPILQWIAGEIDIVSPGSFDASDLLSVISDYLRATNDDLAELIADTLDAGETVDVRKIWQGLLHPYIPE